MLHAKHAPHGLTQARCSINLCFPSPFYSAELMNTNMAALEEGIMER